MEKAKNILTSHGFVRAVLWIAGILAIAAVVTLLVFGRRMDSASSSAPAPNEPIIVSVAAGDTLSKLLSEQGIGHNDINAIANVLKTDAGISGLRADRDKIEFVRDGENNTVSKITVVPGPWRRVELTCDAGGK